MIAPCENLLGNYLLTQHMGKKRNPRSKRVHDSNSGKFQSEDQVNSRTPFGYNDEDEGLLSKLKFW